MASKLAPPCPGCGRTGRRNQQARADWKFRCVNMSCDVLCYSLQDAVDGEAARRLNAPPPPIASHKVPQIALFGREGGVAINDGATDGAAVTDEVRVQARAKEPTA